MKKLIITCLSTLLCTSGFSFAETYVVEAYTMTFVPDVVNVAPGDVIRWEYVTGYPHDVTTGMKCKDDGYLFLDIPSGGSVEWTVPEDAPSEIPYFCSLHCGNGMTGMIYVDTPRMGIGIVESSNCEFSFEEDGATATMAFASYDPDTLEGRDAHFGLGVEIEDGDIEVVVAGGSSPGSMYLLDATTELHRPCLLAKTAHWT
jgi:plastocyanin